MIALILSLTRAYGLVLKIVKLFWRGLKFKPCCFDNWVEIGGTLANENYSH